jgi:hypothetical protein
VDISEWALCDEDRAISRRSKTQATRGGRRRTGHGVGGRLWIEVTAQRLEDLTRQLFQLHDLKGDGVLEEEELVQLNEKIHVLHHGPDADLSDVRTKYRELFREQLDPNGKPVPYETFRRYTRGMLDGLDPDPESQELILEQFIEEARSGRRAFAIPALSRESDLAVAGSPYSAATTSANASGTDTEDTELSWNPNLFVHEAEQESADGVTLPRSVQVDLAGRRPPPSMARKVSAGEWRDARPIDVVLQETGLRGQLGWEGL